MCGSLKVSVIVLVYKVKKYLQESIDRTTSLNAEHLRVLKLSCRQRI